jgi:hypothetical protein
MNDQTQKLLQQLADKLGTSVDRLWVCLVKQAIISSWTNTLLAVLGIVLLAVFLKVAFVMKKLCDKNDDYIPGLVAAWCAVGIMLIIMVVAVPVDLEMTFAGFFNRDYWALYRVLHP